MLSSLYWSAVVVIMLWDKQANTQWFITIIVFVHITYVSKTAFTYSSRIFEAWLQTADLVQVCSVFLIVLNPMGSSRQALLMVMETFQKDKHNCITQPQVHFKSLLMSYPLTSHWPKQATWQSTTPMGQGYIYATSFRRNFKTTDQA